MIIDVLFAFRRFLVVYGEDGACFLLFKSVSNVLSYHGVKADIVFLYASFDLLFDIFLMSFHKFLPDLLTVGEVPILLKLFNSFLFHNSFEDLLASTLVVDQCFLLNKVLYSLSWRLINPVPVPKLLIWLFGLFRALKGGNHAPFL